MMMALSFSPAFVCACARAREDSLKNKKQGQKDRRASNALCQSDACVCLLLSCFLLGWGRAKQFFLENPKFEKKAKRHPHNELHFHINAEEEEEEEERRREKEETYTRLQKKQRLLST